MLTFKVKVPDDLIISAKDAADAAVRRHLDRQTQPGQKIDGLTP